MRPKLEFVVKARTAGRNGLRPKLQTPKVEYFHSLQEARERKDEIMRGRVYGEVHITHGQYSEIYTADKREQGRWIQGCRVW